MLGILVRVIVVMISLMTGHINAGEFYTSEQGNSFYVQKEPWVSWYEALKICASRNMSLITPDTEKKVREINEVMAAHDLLSAWTAGHEVEDMRFVWITTGEYLGYTNWYKGEPDRDTDKPQCIAMHGDGWISYRYYTVQNVICEDPPLVKEKNLELVRIRTNCDRTNALQENNQEVSVWKLEKQQWLNQVIMANKSLELKSLEIEMLKKFHDKEMQLLEEKHNYALKTLRASFDMLANHTGVNKNVYFINRN